MTNERDRCPECGFQLHFHAPSNMLRCDRCDLLVPRDHVANTSTVPAAAPCRTEHEQREFEEAMDAVREMEEQYTREAIANPTDVIVAFVRAGESPAIMGATGKQAIELSRDYGGDVASFFNDVGPKFPTAPGLWMFEGQLWWDDSEDPDQHARGHWRRLNVNESAALLRDGVVHRDDTPDLPTTTGWYLATRKEPGAEQRPELVYDSCGKIVVWDYVNHAPLTDFIWGQSIESLLALEKEHARLRQRFEAIAVRLAEPGTPVADAVAGLMFSDPDMLEPAHAPAAGVEKLRRDLANASTSRDEATALLIELVSFSADVWDGCIEDNEGKWPALREKIRTWVAEDRARRAPPAEVKVIVAATVHHLCERCEVKPATCRGVCHGMDECSGKITMLCRTCCYALDGHQECQPR